MSRDSHALRFVEEEDAATPERERPRFYFDPSTRRMVFARAPTQRGGDEAGASACREAAPAAAPAPPPIATHAEARAQAFPQELTMELIDGGPLARIYTRDATGQLVPQIIRLPSYGAAAPAAAPAVEAPPAVEPVAAPALVPATEPPRELTPAVAKTTPVLARPVVPRVNTVALAADFLIPPTATVTPEVVTSLSVATPPAATLGGGETTMSPSPAAASSLSQTGDGEVDSSPSSSPVVVDAQGAASMGFEPHLVRILLLVGVRGVQ